MEFSLRMVCRTCMCEDGVVSSIFDTKIEHKSNIYSFAEMLISCTNIQIEERDHLTKYICEECQKQLTIAFSFKKQSERADSLLRKIKKNRNDENVETETILGINSDAEEQVINKSNDITNSINNFLLSAEFLDEEQDEIPKDINKRKSFMLTAEFLDENTTTINKPIEITKDVNRKKNLLSAEFLDEEQNEIPSTDNSFELTNDMNNPNQFMLSAEFLNDETFLNENENQESNSSTIEQDNQIVQRKSIYHCKLCSRTFRSKHGLDYHKKIHSGVRKYPCTHPNCGKRFISKQALDRHTNSHTHTQRHLCPECGKVYGTYEGLQYHLKAHQDERPFLCTYCGKMFIKAYNLRAHMWVHNGIKSHACESCGRRYTSAFKLKKHVINKHSNSTTIS